MKINVVLLLAVFCASFCFAQSSSKNLSAVLDAADKYNQSMTYEKIKPFPIYDAGSQEWADYEKYGEFKNLGTKDYQYIVKNSTGLAAASGEGIYPNTQSVLKSPDYNPKKLKGKTSKYVNNDEFQRNFYKWASVTDEDPGIKLYTTGLILENSGNYKHAVKAYYACLVFFPKTVGYTQWQTPWYIAPVCAAKIKYLTREYPEIGVRLIGEDIIIENTFDNDTSNDVFIINPGKLIAAEAEDFKRVTMDLMPKANIKTVAGKGKVKLIRYSNNHFQLIVDDKPYILRGITYSPSRVGLSPDFGTLDNMRDWSFDDYNNNRKIDGPYDTVLDANRNNKKDSDERTVGDFALMKEMGINTLRIYHYADLNKELLKDGYQSYGFMYLIGNLIGMYGKDSGAGWFDGTDYTDKEQRENMFESVRQMVKEYRDEPYVLMWVLGNENNYGTVGSQETGEVGSSNLAPKHPDAYYSFVNECAKIIKSLDPKKRPVVICNGDAFMLDYCAKNAPEIDVYGANVYRGNYGFGQIWQDIARVYNKPVLITEYGCPAYAKGWNEAKIEQGQADYHRACWNSIEDNIAGVKGGAGNALGGVIFEWVDEWWKGGASTDPWYHDVDSQWAGPFLDGRAYEEWFGLCSLGNGANSTFKRQLRKSYFMYRELWKDLRPAN
ncbi:MAG: hypothetical protein LBL00_06425 [Endomicrobium sp.]|jgi:beta-glucuronidase|nr:hypothetical protein [Endomicrobium sp.]